MDCYNANPSSMKVALDNFGAIKTANKKVAILGAMKELGADSEREHKAVVEHTSSLNLDMAVFVGTEFDFVKPTDNMLHFADTAKAKEYFFNNPIAEAIILLKGSNSMHMGDMEAVL